MEPSTERPESVIRPRPYRLREADPERAGRLAAACSLSRSTAQVLLHRGITDAASARDFLDPRLAGLTPPDAMADRSLAAERLARAIRAKERIVVFGDYDVDGTTSATILGEILRALGGDVVVLVANRFDGGYGFSSPALRRARDAGAQLIVTCDCGSSDHPRIDDAMRSGVDVVVVDHHLVPAEPLPALAFLNPHRPDCGFGYKGLCSAGLALSVGAAVRAELGAKLDLRSWLDLVALGTIADVAPLDGDNRRLVRAGLVALASERARPGVVALREVAGMRGGKPIGGVDVAFRLAPRLNAAGRLGDPEITVRLLASRSLPEARALAERIEEINLERRELQERITEAAEAQVLERYGEAPEGGVVAASEGWHRGVVGIVAARLVERFGAPAVVIALEDGEGHGSCRTPDGFSIYRAVAACRDELEKFGGHDAAAGLSLQSSRLDAFREAFDEACRRMRAEGRPLDARPLIDVVLESDDSLPAAGELAALEPVGEGNAEPSFLLRRARVVGVRRVGKGRHLKLTLALGGDRLSAFGWELGDRALSEGDRVDVFGTLRPDTYRGDGSIELRISGFA